MIRLINLTYHLFLKHLYNFEHILMPTHFESLLNKTLHFHIYFVESFFHMKIQIHRIKVDLI